MHKHLTQNDRSALGAMRSAGYSQTEIADTLRVNRSTISRELSRNPGLNGAYHAKTAQIKAKRRRKEARYHCRKIENDPFLAESISSLIHPLRSPEVIAHDLPVSHEAIYAWIYRSMPSLKEKLPQRGKKRRRYGSKRGKKQGWTQNVRSIEERPEEAKYRLEVGHYEGDTIKGSKGALLTLVDRKSRYAIAPKLPGQKCDPVHAKLKEQRKKINACSFTFDRGGEFALWRMIERDANAKVYFADARAPWQRGSNENANQRMRRVFPKGTDFSRITQKEIDGVLWIMNHTKRKCLNWQTPCEVYGDCCISS